jgi:hypothetical protein
MNVRRIRWEIVNELHVLVVQLGNALIVTSILACLWMAAHVAIYLLHYCLFHAFVGRILCLVVVFWLQSL